MPGRTPKNTRKGHRAEAAGIDLLRSLCAVAQVPQSEDIGFDAIATLLREEGRFFFAESSFYVQFKARSVRQIEYPLQDYQWFRRLELPLFIGSVDLKQCHVELFSTHFLAFRPDGDSYESAVVHLDKPESTIEGETVHQWLSKPILEWEAGQTEEEAFLEMGYGVLKGWLGLLRAGLALRGIRRMEGIKWETNEVPTLTGAVGVMSHPSEMDADFELAMPFIDKLCLHFIGADPMQPSDEALALYLLVRSMENRGIKGARRAVEQMALRFGMSFSEVEVKLEFDAEIKPEFKSARIENPNEDK